MADKKVLIVESPAKARTISQILKNFDVVSSYGHIRDLPRKGLGVDIKNNFAPKYHVMRDKMPIVKNLKEAIKNADVYLATDFDREGEAIAWHLSQILKLADPKRITFHEITSKAISKAVENPRKILNELVDAQKARRIIDRLFGYKLSPFLWRKIVRGLSAGRVQSAALRLIVEREQEIRDFKSENYFRLQALFKEQGMEFSALLSQIDKKILPKLYFRKKKDVEKILDEIKDKLFKISAIIDRKKLISPPAPYITASLQQDAFVRLRFSAKKTMFLAQQLYESMEIEGQSKGLITYMRTDSPSLAKEAQKAARNYIAKNLGKDLLPKIPKVYKARSGAQEAHEAIRPTNFSLTPEKVKKYLGKDHFRLYELIFWRTLASQMKEAVFRENIIYFQVRGKIRQLAENYIFRAQGLKDEFLSFLKYYSYHFTLSMLPRLEKGKKYKPQRLEILSLETKPKSRYTEAALIKTLERLGIGRPSTYAPIIGVLYQRNYIERKKRYLFPTELGEKVTDFLKEHFSHLIDYKFTARMEKELDEIAEGKLEWISSVKDFYHPLAELLKKKDLEIDKGKITEKEYLDRKCPKCGSKLLTRFGRFGKFISCENFPNCKYKEAIKKNINLEDELDKKTKDKIDELKKNNPKCSQCGGELKLRKSRFGYFLGCVNYPKCRFIAPLNKFKRKNENKE